MFNIQAGYFRMLGETRRDYWAIPWKDRYIWGATAAMLVILDNVRLDEAPQ